MSIYDKINKMLGIESPEEKLYKVLNTDEYKVRPYDYTDLGEGMAVISETMWGWWKHRFLINHNTKCAYEFMNSDQKLVTVTQDDIDWDSLKELPEDVQRTARALSFHFPSFIRKFQNGVAEVSWQLNPDGRYYMDEDGYGMTDDEEVEIYGFIDQNAKVLVKFKKINENYRELDKMRQEAEEIVKLTFIRITKSMSQIKYIHERRNIKEGGKMLDIERIIQTGIPDIAPVYGGVRGRTISSHKQAYAWKTIVAAGLKQVIDLRKDYSADRFPELCRQYGVDYFHYPIDNDHETIVKMAELFPVFCEKIDKGDFYIACAMGLHRTDIALCTYWIFYAADKGIEPPPIRGYRREDGHDTNKIMRVLNAFYQYMTEKEGKEPMPIEVFKERKKVINELSKR